MTTKVKAGYFQTRAIINPTPAQMLALTTVANPSPNTMFHLTRRCARPVSTAESSMSPRPKNFLFSPFAG
jgi:hypothetical protein